MNNKSLIQLAFPILLGLVVLFSACSKEEDNNADVNQRLQGNWNVTSWTTDGNEQMGGILASSYTLQFTSNADEGGDAHWQIINGQGFVTNLDGAYVVKDGGKKMDFNGAEWEVSFQGDDLKLESSVVVDAYVLIAEKQ